MELAANENIISREQTSGRPMAIITGASSGIGRALAVELAARGYDLCLVARRKDLLEQLSSELMCVHGVNTDNLAVDLTRPGSVAEIASYFHSIDRVPELLVNNAGIGNTGEFSNTDWAQERQILQLNVLALTELTKMLLPGMKARGHGRILNIASTAAFKPGPYYAVYAATKSYVLSFSQALNRELSGTGVSVTCLCPGPTKTEFARRAGIREDGMFYRMRAMSAATVARHGVRALLAGKSVAVPGLSNAVAAFATQLLPGPILMRITGAIRRGTVN